MLVDVPMWPAHGRLWAHLVSDSSLEELHAFATARGSRGAASTSITTTSPRSGSPSSPRGAQQVSAHELTRRLIASGLRVKSRDR